MTIWDDRYKSGEGLRWWPNEELVRFLGKTYGSMKRLPCIGMRALELGSGTGCNLWALRDWGFEDFGIEASAEAVLLANAYLLWRWGMQYDRIHHAMLPEALRQEHNEMFDLVVDCQTIQHLSDDDHVKVYAEVARVLKPGGRFWSMHWRDGDSYKLYGGVYPELRDWHLKELLGLLEQSFTSEELTMIHRTDLIKDLTGGWFVVSMVKP